MNNLLKLKDELRRVFGKEFNDAIVEWDDKVKVQVKNALDYRFFLLLVDDKFSYHKDNNKKYKHDDFKGDLSVEKFLNEWKEKLTESKENKLAA